MSNFPGCVLLILASYQQSGYKLTGEILWMGIWPSSYCNLSEESSIFKSSSTILNLLINFKILQCSCRYPSSQFFSHKGYEEPVNLRSLPFPPIFQIKHGTVTLIITVTWILGYIGLASKIWFFSMASILDDLCPLKICQFFITKDIPL